MQPQTKFVHSAVLPWQNDGCLVIRDLSFGLGVDTNQVQVLPNLLDQLVEVPLVLGGDGHVVGHLRDDVEFFDGDLIDLVHGLDAGSVDSVAFDNVDELVDSAVLFEVDVSVGNPVLVADGFDGVFVHFGEFEAVSFHDTETALILALDVDLRWSLVESDSETFQLTLNDLLMCDGLDHI